MSVLHFLNVGKGDCTLIQHNSGNTSLIDICKGNYEAPEEPGILDWLFESSERPRLEGDFGMSLKPTNPISYLKSIGVNSLFRFILTHPDMDHMDGFNALCMHFSILNFWDSGVRKAKPDFANNLGYHEADWDRYVKVRDDQEPTKVVHPLAGYIFQCANKTTEGAAGGDGLHILAPDSTLVNAANQNGDVNDGSYVLLYRSAGGKILIPGDAHDETWDYVIKHYREDVANCSVLFAPHHGRKSGRNFDFLNVVKPKVTFFGCASSGHLAYNAWSNRGLKVITNNQAGNVVLDCADSRISIFVQNEEFAAARGCDTNLKNDQGYVFCDSIAAQS